MNGGSYYTLFYFKDGETSVNLVERSDLKSYAVYVRNALLLARSLPRGSVLCVITNDAARYRAILEKACPDPAPIRLTEIDFSLDVPVGIGFFSAHYKLDVFRYLSNLDEDAFPCLLLDSDMFFIDRNRGDCFGRVSSDQLGCYDISAQVFPAYGRSKVQSDIKMICPSTVEIDDMKWFGGEFLVLGSPSVAKELVNCIDVVWPLYRNIWGRLHHQGDEAVVSAAINIMRQKNSRSVKICNSFVLRYWSGQVLHRQVGIFSLIGFAGWLHLPQDKKWLSFLAGFIKRPALFGFAIQFPYILYVLSKRFLMLLRRILLKSLRKYD